MNFKILDPVCFDAWNFGLQFLYPRFWSPKVAYPNDVLNVRGLRIKFFENFRFLIFQVLKLTKLIFHKPKRLSRETVFNIFLWSGKKIVKGLEKLLFFLNFKFILFYFENFIKYINNFRIFVLFWRKLSNFAEKFQIINGGWKFFESFKLFMKFLNYFPLTKILKQFSKFLK
jgi:hypothetical protein